MLPSEEKKMANKRNFLEMLGLMLLLGALVAGCATTQNAGRYDTSGSADNDCTIVLNGGAWLKELTKITSFDGQPVDWRSKITSMSAYFGVVGPFQISIPAGKHSLTGWSGQVGLTAGAGTPQMSTTYDFIAGHTYKIEASGSLQVTDITK
jgi:hypothetical protein